MSLVSSQDLVAVTVPGMDLAGAVEELRTKLQEYPDARVISMTQQSHSVGIMHPTTTLAAAIEYAQES